MSPSDTTTKDPDNPNGVSTKYILEDSITNLWVDYRLASYLNTECESSFRKSLNRSKIFTKANHDTDMCGNCLEGIKSKADMVRLESLADEHELFKAMDDDLDDEDEKMGVDQDEFKLNDDERYEWDGVEVFVPDGDDVGKYGFDLKYLLDFVNNTGALDGEERRWWNDKILDWYYICNHRYQKTETNLKYTADMNHPAPNTMYITIDFKQNMVIRRQKTERNALYNARESRTVFGVYLSCQAGRFYVNHLSDCISHTATFAVACIRQLFETQWVKDLIAANDIRHVVVWSDKGKHFACCHNLYFWLIELIYKYQWVSTVTYNFFVAKHGKSFCDAHFGRLNYYYSIYVKSNEEGVHNTAQLAAAILEGYNKAQRTREYRDNNVNHHVIQDMVDSAEVRCINFDLDQGNPNTNYLLSSKHDQVHVQYALIWKDKINSFNCYKVDRQNIDDTDINNYWAHRSDLKFHKLIGHHNGAGILC